MCLKDDVDDDDDGKLIGVNKHIKHIYPPISTI